MSKKYIYLPRAMDERLQEISFLIRSSSANFGIISTWYTKEKFDNWTINTGILSSKVAKALFLDNNI